jgi:hypothetical protein
MLMFTAHHAPMCVKIFYYQLLHVVTELVHSTQFLESL